MTGGTGPYRSFVGSDACTDGAARQAADAGAIVLDLNEQRRAE
ncbi:hypothetical protein [Micromonospora sp. LOL_023]